VRRALGCASVSAARSVCVRVRQRRVRERSMRYKPVAGMLSREIAPVSPRESSSDCCPNHHLIAARIIIRLLTHTGCVFRNAPDPRAIRASYSHRECRTREGALGGACERALEGACEGTLGGALKGACDRPYLSIVFGDPASPLPEHSQGQMQNLRTAKCRSRYVDLNMLIVIG